jgi:seryl-tRNA synthetase
MPYTEAKSPESEESSTEAKRTKLDNDGLPKEEYEKKRERNNVAVRKSRKKAKQKIEETRQRVDDLAQENEDLRTKVALLQKELNVLRSLFANGGISDVPTGVNVIFTSSGDRPDIVVKTEVPEDETS